MLKTVIQNRGEVSLNHRFAGLRLTIMALILFEDESTIFSESPVFYPTL
jgi:hypothetical protein